MVERIIMMVARPHEGVSSFRGSGRRRKGASVPQQPTEFVASARAESRVDPWIRTLRPVQWTKNALLFAGVVFARKLHDPELLLLAVLAFVSFCALSSAIYIINDLHDVAADRLHPTKRDRPIAAGHISANSARMLALGLATLGLGIAAGVNTQFLLAAMGYLVLMNAYVYLVRAVAIVDVFAIAAGFVVRAVAGALAVNVPISPWLLCCTALLALFLGFCKRRSELAAMDRRAGAVRPVLDEYSLPLLDQLISICAAATLISYAFYTFDARSVPRNGVMMLTVPFVAFALFRYLFLVYRRREGGSPEWTLLRDIPLLLTILCWAGAALIAMYAGG